MEQGERYCIQGKIRAINFRRPGGKSQPPSHRLAARIILKETMKSVTSEFTVEWGHCDPAGIVFYPNFFIFFDAGAWNLFIAAGLELKTLRERYGANGFPVVDTRAEFRHPCRQMDKLTLTTTMDAIYSKTFIMSHELYNDGVLAVRGKEVRVLGMAHPDDPEKLKAGAIPKELAARFGP